MKEQPVFDKFYIISRVFPILLVLTIVLAQTYLVKHFDYDAFNIAFLIGVVFTACYYSRRYATAILLLSGFLDWYIFQAPSWSLQITWINAIEVLIFMAIGFTIIFIIKSSKSKQRRSAIEQKRFEMALRAGTDGVLMSNGQGKFIFASDSIKQILGYTPEEYLEINPYDLVHPDDRLKVLADVQAFKDEHKSTLAFCYRHKHRNGSWVWVEGNLSNFLLEPTINAILCNFRDVTQRKLLEEQKNDFINFAAHEFKSPLSIINAYTQILLNKAKSEGKPTKELTTIGHQTSHLIQIVKNYLNLAMIEKTHQPLNKEEFYLGRLTEDVLAAFTTQESYAIIKTINTELKVNGDKERVRQVIMNYLSNAVKYSPGSDRIEVSVFEHEAKVRFAVQDFGMGISEADQTRIFKRYSRVNTSSAIEGSGIGLYLCSQIITLHQGNFGCKSKIGEGSEFWFDLDLVHERISYSDKRLAKAQIE